MAKRRAAPTPQRRKRTLTLTGDTSIRISIEAERRGIDRSACAEMILAAALRHIVVSIRSRDAAQDDAAA